MLNYDSCQLVGTGSRNSHTIHRSKTYRMWVEEPSDSTLSRHGPFETSSKDIAQDYKEDKVDANRLWFESADCCYRGSE